MSSKELDIDSVTDLFSKTKIISESGVTFANKSLKLNNENDAKEVIDAILACETLTYLNLEGNTLGIDAAKGIAKALEAHPEFKRALWKDLFTGRLKEEIPEALRFLGSGLIVAGATLSELDLSDNAFGPIGVEGLASLLKSPCCYALQELKLNNNGLGITGGKLLAKALMVCYNDSKALNKPLALKVFIAGRNRLENEGALALAEVFKTLQSLEEIKMPQNGIYHVGVTALANAFQYNKNLRVIDLNDNTVSKKGSIAIAKVLPKLQSLTCLNLGDCLIRTPGAISIASALEEGHENLEEVHLASNEISKSGGLALANALAKKKRLKKVVLDSNQFGESVDYIKDKLAAVSDDAVISISDDEGSEDEEDEVSEESEKEEDEEKGSELEEGETFHEKQMTESSAAKQQNYVQVTADEFLNNPTPERFISLGTNRASLIVEEIKMQPEDRYLESLVSALMKVSSLTVCNIPNVQSAAFSCSDVLYEEIFKSASSTEQLSFVNNSLLVHIGLLKSEDKKFKIPYDTEGCKIALQRAMKQNYFPAQSKDTMEVFLERQIKKDVVTFTL